MEWLALLVAMAAFNILFVDVVTRIVKDATHAILRVRKKPTAANYDRRNFVIAHQVTLFAFTWSIYIFTKVSQPEDGTDWLSLIMGIVYLWWIRNITNVDARIKRLRKQQKAAQQRVEQTPDMEEGVS